MCVNIHTVVCPPIELQINRIFCFVFDFSEKYSIQKVLLMLKPQNLKSHYV